MSEYTYIIKNEEIIIVQWGYLLPSDAIQLARADGVKGKFEIHHVLAEPNEDEKLLVLYFIDKDDKIIGQVYHRPTAPS